MVLRLLVLLAAFGMGGCAELPLLAPGERADFEFNGRIAVRYRDEASSGNVSWRHRAAADDILLTSPLGQGVARIVRSGETVTLTTPDGKSQSASDAEALTEAVLGFRLPLAGLTDWVRARQAPGPADAQRDSEGRLSRLVQSGWDIEYLEYAGGLPSRMRLTYPGIDIRLAISEWKEAQAAREAVK
jgi:outer membrane lipoprotein LolB